MAKKRNVLLLLPASGSGERKKHQTSDYKRGCILLGTERILCSHSL